VTGETSLKSWMAIIRGRKTLLYMERLKAFVGSAISLIRIRRMGCDERTGFLSSSIIPERTFVGGISTLFEKGEALS